MRETPADSGREFLKCLILCSKLREVDSGAQFRGVVRAKSNGNAVFLGETEVMKSISRSLLRKKAHYGNRLPQAHGGRVQCVSRYSR